MIEQVREIDCTIGCDTCKKNRSFFFFFGGNYQQLSLNQFYAAATQNESNSFATNLPEV